MSVKNASAPHIHSGASTRRVMLDVILALVPAAVAAVIIFGVKAAIVIASCVIAAVASEAIFNIITKKEQTVGDLSAAVTGLLLGLNLSTNVPVWQCVIGSMFAIIVVKCFFGGLGHNFANPAITGRVFMLIAFAAVAGGALPDAVTGATPLEVLKTSSVEGLPSISQMLIGMRGGAVGEGCIAALVLGYAYLVLRKVIKWYIPVIFIGTVFVCFLIASGDIVFSLYEILAGGLFLGAIFMATDYVTTPITSVGRMVFAFCCGLLTFIIRQFCAYP